MRGDRIPRPDGTDLASRLIADCEDKIHDRSDKLDPMALKRRADEIGKISGGA